MTHPNTANTTIRKHSDTAAERDNLEDQSSLDSATILPGERISESAEDRKAPYLIKEKERELGNNAFAAQGKDEDDILWVDWDGPDDPENPKKYGRPVSVLHD